MTKITDNLYFDKTTTEGGNPTAETIHVFRFSGPEDKKTGEKSRVENWNIMTFNANGSQVAVADLGGYDATMAPMSLVLQARDYVWDLNTTAKIKAKFPVLPKAGDKLRYDREIVTVLDVNDDGLSVHVENDQGITWDLVGLQHCEPVRNRKS